MTSRGATLCCFFVTTYVALYGISSVGAELPEEVTFQVYVAFDNVLHTAFSNQNEALKYAVVFFNAVNLIFREMTNPRIKFEVVMFHDQNVPFTSEALAVEGDEVNATASLPKAAAHTSKLPQFNSSDIIFIMSGRKVFSKGNVQKDYLPPGLTTEGGICNSNKRVVIVSDIGKRFEGLPNAGFQLARLLGAPTSCTIYYYKLSGNSWLFKLNDCHKNAIRNNLKKLDKENHQETQQCFAKRYATSLSSLIKDLPSSLITPQQICEAHKGGDKREQLYYKNICIDNAALNEPPDSLAQTILIHQKGGCFFRCCYSLFLLLRFDKEMATYFSFDGSPCNDVPNGICALGQCITDYKP